MRFPGAFGLCVLARGDGDVSGVTEQGADGNGSHTQARGPDIRAPHFQSSQSETALDPVVDGFIFRMLGHQRRLAPDFFQNTRVAKLASKPRKLAIRPR